MAVRGLPDDISPPPVRAVCSSRRLISFHSQPFVGRAPFGPEIAQSARDVILMKKPKPDVQNQRILRLTRQFFLLPLVLFAAVYAWARRLRQRGKTAKVVRFEDQQRQSRARRELRGLPPDHVQHVPITID